jgi:hypothetical protein
VSREITPDECAAICEELARELPPTTDRATALREAAARLNHAIGSEDDVMFPSDYAELPEHEAWSRLILFMLDDLDCQEHFREFGERYKVKASGEAGEEARPAGKKKDKGK